MKKATLLIIVFIFLVLDFLALDDISTGNEPSFFGEYAILIVSVAIFGLIGFYDLQKKHRFTKPPSS